MAQIITKILKYKICLPQISVYYLILTLLGVGPPVGHHHVLFIKNNTLIFNTLLFADDQFIISDTEDNLQSSPFII